MRRSLKKFGRRLRVPFEWLGIGLALALFTTLSHRALFAVCDVAAGLMRTLDRRGRRRAHDNLAILFGDRLTPRREDLIVRRSYRNMARTIGHAFWTCRDARRRVAAVGELSSATRAFLDANRPAVTVSGHIGCWEILSQLAFLAGHPMMSVAKDIGTHGMTRLLMKARESIGQEIVSANKAFLPLMKGLRRGKSLGLLVDQPVRPREGGVWVRFCGRPVPVSAAPAYFAAKAGSPIIVAWSRPLRDGRYRCEMISSYTAAEAADTWRVTQACLTDLERIVRRHPSCWVLNYNEFRKMPTPEELQGLLENERKNA